MTLFLLLHTTSPWGATAPADAGALLNTGSGSPRTIDEGLNGASLRDGPLPPRSVRRGLPVSSAACGRQPSGTCPAVSPARYTEARSTPKPGEAAEYACRKRRGCVSFLQIARNWTRAKCSRPGRERSLQCCWPARSAAAQRRPLRAEDTRLAAGVQDNSFLIEEAYNQEAGVVQHIANLRRQGHDWNFVFSQEWPVLSQTHQFSYTVPYLWLRGDQGSVDGLGDSYAQLPLPGADGDEHAARLRPPREPDPAVGRSQQGDRQQVGTAPSSTCRSARSSAIA